jgi:hypothetical protein
MSGFLDQRRWINTLGSRHVTKMLYRVHVRERSRQLSIPRAQ